MYLLICIEQKEAEPSLASTSTGAMSTSASETSLEQMSACTYGKRESETWSKIEEGARRKETVDEGGEACSREPSEKGRKERADKETVMMEDNATCTEQSDIQSDVQSDLLRQDGVLNVDVRVDGSTSDEGHELQEGEKTERMMASDGGGEQVTLNVEEQSGEERQKDEAVSMAS